MNESLNNAQENAEEWKDEVAATEPVTATSEDGAVTIEMAVDLTVRRVRLEPRATRDLDVLEEQLRDVFNEAVKTAQEANPINRRVRDAFGSGQQDLQDKLADMQGQMRQRAEAAEAHFAELKRRMEMSRSALRKNR